MNALLTARDLGHNYGSTNVFQGLHFSITAGQRLAVIGVSGSGKTTLLRLLAGLEKPRVGSIERAPGFSAGMVFQDLALWPNLTVLENVAMAARRLPDTARRVATMTALESCHVAELAARLPGTLSIGQQQRVALARSIVAHPRVLLLDEPFSSLDLVLKHELFATVRKVIEGRALVLVTHDPLEALALCDTALVLEAGAIIEYGPLRKLMEQPISELLRLFRQNLSAKRAT